MRVLMVCLGNICRSPLAQGILEAQAKDAGLDWTIDSAGTGNWHLGAAPDSRSIEVAQRHGIDIRQQAARQFTPADLDDFDLILPMDTTNASDIIRQAAARNTEHVKLILDYVYPGENKSVPDPYYGGKDGFEQVYAMLDEACRALIHQHA